jgi:hypothetical protein
MPPTPGAAEPEQAVAVALDAAAPEEVNTPARDVAVGLFILAWAVVGWISVAGNSRLFGDFGRDPGPALMPVVVLAILSAGGLAILATAIVRLVRGAGPQPAERTTFGARLRPHLVPATLLVTLAVYPTVMHAIGYAAATAVFVLGWILALSGWRYLPHGRARLLAAVAAVGATAAVVAILYTSFVVVIRAPLP